MTINKYIHLNRVRVRSLGGHEKRADPEGVSASDFAAARVEALRTYAWSSYRYYSGKEKAPGWLRTQTVLGLLSQRASFGLYRQQLEEAVSVSELETDWKAERKARLLLGSKHFVEQVTSLLKGEGREQSAVRQASVGRLAWPATTAVVSEQWGQDWETLQAGHGHGALAAALYLGRQYSGKTLRELGQLAGGCNTRL